MNILGVVGDFSFKMKITGISLKNIRGFANIPKTDFSQSINVLIGPNNSGKSTILRCILSLQQTSLTNTDITIGQNNGEFDLFYSGGHFNIKPSDLIDKIKFELNPNRVTFIRKDNRKLGVFQRFPQTEPQNLIYPYLSKRKVAAYDSVINEQNAYAVSGNFSNLFAKIDRLVTPQFQPGNSEYVEACKNILGFEISTLAKGSGKQAVYFIKNNEHIPLTAMGEGVANILGLITDLCVAENRVFLIEEPENDIHPSALKSLLELILSKSDSNQFFISTHSNIVMKYLGGEKESKVFEISNNVSDNTRPLLKISNIREVSSNPLDRQKVLEDLGYDFFDLDLWKGWLFLEESSAERIIRDHLIRWFCPKLQYQLRTFSAGSLSEVKPKFRDFNKLFVFLHLEPTYKNRVWVYVDSGNEENAIIEDLKVIYGKSGWNTENFNQFQKHDFENYYPNRFQNEINEALKISNKQEKRRAKLELLKTVLNWIRENDGQAKKEFKESASEVITILRKIHRHLNHQ